MTASIHIEVSHDEVSGALRRLQASLEDTTPLFRIIGETVVSSVDRNFTANGRPRWKPSKRTLEDGGQTLSLTGRLRRSITAEAGNGFVAVGTNVRHAGVHQFGAKKGSFGVRDVLVRRHDRRTRSGNIAIVREHRRRQRLPWGDIPARPFLVVQDEDWREIGDVINDYLTRSIR